MTTTSEESTRLSVVEAKVDGVATAVGQTHDRINQVETRIGQVEVRINQLESRMDAQFQEVREGQRQIFLAIITAGTVITMALVGLLATLAFRIV